MKFGGTSVGNAERITQVTRIVHAQVSQGDQILVVLSAMSGVTNTLLISAREAAHGKNERLPAARQELQHRHLQIVDELVKDEAAQAALRAAILKTLDTFEELCNSISVLGELTPRGSDAVGSLGERLIVPIVAQVLKDSGIQAEAVDAAQLIVTDDNFGSADPIMGATREQARARLLPLLEASSIPVITGFIGATRANIVTTLGRGGSDYTATILGSALDADQVWIWTDVNGVMTTDPNIVPEAHSLPEISYSEAAELAYFGAKVIHPKTILPVAEKSIPVRILNSFNPTHRGTLIVREPSPGHTGVRAITAIRKLSLITVEGRGMLGIPGIASRVFSTIAREQISVLMISQSSSEQNICLLVEAAAAERALAALQNEFELERLRQNIEDIWAQNNVVIVAIVGAGLRGSAGLAAQVFSALAEKHINILAIAQGSSEYNLSLTVAEQDADEAVRAIHNQFRKTAFGGAHA